MITSADNPKVRSARSLLERRGRERKGLCLVEGTRLIRDVLRAGSHPALVFFASPAQESPANRELLAALSAASVPLWEVTPKVLDTLSDTVNTQGVIAVLPIPRLEPPSEPELTLVLDRIRDPGNLGTILRGAAAAGAELVLLTHGCADPWGPKALRAGMGAQFRVAVESHAGGREIAKRATGKESWAADASGDIVYDQVDWSQPAVLIVGGETEGLSAEAIALSTGRLAIPMANQVESLNAAMAATVLLFEAARQRRSALGNSGI
jgi:TrmH family RNA methyltransferase